MVAWISFVFKKGEPVSGIIEKVISDSGIEEGLKKYTEMKEENHGEYLFSESMMNALGYKLLGQEKIKEAIEIFKLNVKEYPDSFNAYDSLGEAYMKDGETELAIMNYQKSLDLNPNNENGKKMLENLQSGE